MASREIGSWTLDFGASAQDLAAEPRVREPENVFVPVSKAQLRRRMVAIKKAHFTRRRIPKGTLPFLLFRFQNFMFLINECHYRAGQCGI